MADGQARFHHPEPSPASVATVANDSLREPKANQPLAGLNIVVTRPREQAADLVQRIEQLGGNAIVVSVAGDHALPMTTQRCANVSHACTSNRSAHLHQSECRALRHGAIRASGTLPALC